MIIRKKRYWQTRELIVIGTFAALIKVSTLLIAIAGGGSGVGIKQVGGGLVVIGTSGRMATDDEIARYNLTVHKWAIDGVGIVVNPANQVRALSQKQIIAIFAGDITNWSEAGGADHRINLTLYKLDEILQGDLEQVIGPLNNEYQADQMAVLENQNT